MASQIPRRLFSTTARRLQSNGDLKSESKRNPELMVRPSTIAAKSPQLNSPGKLAQQDKSN